VTIVGTMTVYRCDHEGCTRNVASSIPQVTRWSIADNFHRSTRGHAGRDYCEEHVTDLPDYVKAAREQVES
jgi:hypothetical protein